MNKLITKTAGLALCLTMAVGVGAAISSENRTAEVAHAAANTATLSFANKTGSASFSIKDSAENTWTVTVAGTTTFSKNNSSYLQIGSKNNPASSISLTTTLSETYNITGFTSLWGGFSGTAGAISMKIGDTEVAKGSLSTTSDVTVSQTTGQVQTGNTLSIDVTSISRGVKIYSLSYKYESFSDTEATGLTITPSSSTVYVGESITLTTSLSGGSGTYEKTISWTSSDASVIAAPANSEEGEKVTLVALKEGTTTITGTVVTPGSASSSITITVKAARVLSSIKVTTAPTKTFYIVGEQFDSTNMVVTATFSDGSSSDVTSSCSFAPDGALTLSDNVITITYTQNGVSKTTTQSIQVKNPPATYTISGTPSAPDFTSDENIPTGSTATWAQTASPSSLGQMTSGNKQTLTINVSNQIIVTDIVLNMRSNSSDGAGGVTYTADSGEEVVLIASATKFNAFGDSTSYGTSFKDVVVGTGLEIEVNNTFELVISATTNSLYCQSFKIYYEYAPAKVAVSKSVVTLSADGTSSDTVELSSFNLDGEVTFNAVSKDTSVLPQSNLSITDSVLTIKAGTTISDGVTVEISATNGTITTPAIQIKVILTVIRNITGLTITTEPNKVFKENTIFKTDGIVLSATFDAGDSPVIYSEEAGNFNDLVFKIDGTLASVNETVLTSIGTHTVSVELTVGNATKEATYQIEVVSRTYYTKATDMNQLWDGQKLVIANADATAIADSYVGKNNISSVAITFDSSNKIDEDNLETGAEYTLGRIVDNTDNTTVYTLFDGTNYIYAAGTKTSGTNYLIGKTTLDEECYWNISFDAEGNLSVVSKYNTKTPYMQFNNSFACYNKASYTGVSFFIKDTDNTGVSAANAFEQNYMHMDDYNSNLGWCKDTEHKYYQLAKGVFNAMTEDDKLEFSVNHEEAYLRLEAWAEANGESIDGNMNLVSLSKANILNAIKDNSPITIIVIISLIGVVSLSMYFFYDKRRRA